MPHMQKTKTATSIGVTLSDTSSCKMAFDSSDSSSSPGAAPCIAIRVFFCLYTNTIITIMVWISKTHLY